ncbi:MAG: universal stress protein [Rubripirellula sp.]|nr:universal stress protein [Rubripirellula sp.]
MAGLHSKITVAPVDFSDLSFNALEKAIEITGDGTVHVIHVLIELNTMEPGNLYGTVTDDSRIAAVRQNLEERLSDPKYANVKIHAKIGDAGREIVELANAEQAELIVMPSHGYGFLKHMLLGSVAERVVRLAHCPTLILRS